MEVIEEVHLSSEDYVREAQTACLKLDPRLLSPALCVSNAGRSTNRLFSQSSVRRSTEDAPSLRDIAVLVQAGQLRHLFLPEEADAIAAAAAATAGTSGAATAPEDDDRTQVLRSQAAATAAIAWDGNDQPGTEQTETVLERLLVARNLRHRPQSSGGARSSSGGGNGSSGGAGSRPASPKRPKSGKPEAKSSGKLTGAALSKAADALAASQRTSHHESAAPVARASSTSPLRPSSPTHMHAHSAATPTPAAAAFVAAATAAGGSVVPYPGAPIPGAVFFVEGSAAFRAPSREQAGKVGRVKPPERDAPGPGHYAVKHVLQDKRTLVTEIRPASATTSRWPASAPGNAVPLLATTRAAHMQQEQLSTPGTSAPPSARTQAAARATNSQFNTPRGGHAGPSAATNAATNADETDSQAADDAAEAAAEAAAAAAAAAAEAAECIAGLPPGVQPQLVHERAPQQRPGSAAFKSLGRDARPRPATAGAVTGSLDYFREGYDHLARPVQKVMAISFSKQTQRPPMAIASDAPAALGPGAYMRSAKMPTSLTGKHVAAGHKEAASTVNFNRMAARPGSAPMLQGSEAVGRPWSVADAAGRGGGGKGGSARTGCAEEAGVRELWSMLGLGPQQAGQGGHGTITATVRAAAAGQPAGSCGQNPSRSARPYSAPVRGAASTAAGYTSSRPPSVGRQRAQPPSAFGPGGAVSASAAGVLGHNDICRFSSTGLAQRVKGGAFSSNSRASAARCMRVMGCGNVVPPAAVAVINSGTEMTAEPNMEVQAHMRRAPAWSMPPNRIEMSRKWRAKAAMAALNGHS